ncbi:MAG: ATP-binding protein [Gemmatimonadota bacterium]|nr:ATP-binding protein [Gemmatimonadota bacterium]
MKGVSAAKILLVDDRAENLLALEAILETLGHRLVRARSGEEALRAVLEHDFAVILLDVQMPGLNGFQTAEMIKGRERSRITPIIFLTALNRDEQYVHQGYSVGAVDYMTKPFEPDVLRSKVAVFVELYQQREQLRRQEEQLREGQRRELELSHRTELMEAEARSTSELKGLNEQLQARQRELEEAISARSRFYASMSHELRTPINAILGYNALMLDEIYGPLNPKQVHGLDRTQKAAKHLLELVNDVLDLSKIEAGKLELQVEPVQVLDIIEELFVTVTPLAEQRGSALDFHRGPEIPPVVTDPRRVRQILLNLLSNAIKFGGGKPIRVVCSPTPDRGVEVQVIDQGAGISPDDQLRIFEEFVQLQDPTGQEGTGLGLPISRRLAITLNGTLEVVSERGSGSRFRLTLPASTEVSDPEPSPQAI